VQKRDFIEGVARRGWGSLTAAPRARPALWLEAALAALVLASFLPWLVQVLHDMALSSLNGDEIWSFRQTGERGLWLTWTDYYAANNHILFNLLTGLVAEGPLPAWRLRLLSFLAYLGGMALLLLFLGRRRRFLEAAVILVVFWGSQEHTQLMLEARGYAFVSLFALGAALAVFAYLEAPRARCLQLLGLCCFAGTATLPNFVLFAAPLLVLLLIAERSRAVLLCGLATGAAIALFYAPTVGQVLREAANYADTWGRFFADAAAPLRVIGVYLYDGQAPGWAIFATLAGALLAPLLLAEPAWRRAAAVVAGGVVLFWIACLVLETPLPRTAAFVLAPFTLLAGLALFGLFGLCGPWARLALGLPLAAFLIYTNLARAERFHLVPDEDWLAMAQTVERLFPAGTPIQVLIWAHHLRIYLAEDYPLAEGYEPVAFAAGAAVVVENEREERRLAGADLPPGTLLIRVPQRWGDYMALWFLPPAAPPALTLAPEAAAALAGGAEGARWQASGPQSLTATPAVAQPLRALVLVGPAEAAPRLVAAHLLLPDGELALEPWRLWQRDGVAALDLRGLPAARAIEVSLRPITGREDFLLTDAWLVPQ